MSSLVWSGQVSSALMLMLVAAVGWFVAGLSAASALSGRQPAPGRRALGQILPLMCFVLLSLLMHQPELAVGVIFASSVASLTLGLGMVVVFCGRLTSLQPRRTWCAVLPAALIALLCGFSGRLGWIHAMALGLEGMALGLLWDQDRPHEPSARSAKPQAVMRGVQLVFALLLSGFCAWAGLRASRDLADGLRLHSAVLIASVMIGPAMAMPGVIHGVAISRRGRFDDAVSLHVGFVLLNLCAVLPAAVIVWRLTSVRYSAANLGAIWAQLNSVQTSLAYPLAVWRIDTVLLIVLGLLLAPVSLGKWRLSKAEGYTLLLGYVIYMLLSAAMAR